MDHDSCKIMYPYILNNRLMGHESILFQQNLSKKAEMNRFMVLECPNRLSTMGMHESRLFALIFSHIHKF